MNTRKKFNRSLTEVRPDAYIFDDGLHFEVRPVDADNQLIRKSIENLNEVYIDVHTFPILTYRSLFSS